MCKIVLYAPIVLINALVHEAIRATQLVSTCYNYPRRSCQIFFQASFKFLSPVESQEDNLITSL